MQRLKTTSAFHWAKVATGSVNPSSTPLQHKRVDCTAQDLDEVAKVSAVIELLQGECPNKSLLKAFNQYCKKNLSEFSKKFPDYTYHPGGRKVGSKNKGRG